MPSAPVPSAAILPIWNAVIKNQSRTSIVDLCKIDGVKKLTCHILDKQIKCISISAVIQATSQVSPESLQGESWQRKRENQGWKIMK